MCSYNEVINDSLATFKGMQHYAGRKLKTVNAFVRTLKYLFYKANCPDFCHQSLFIRYGSNRERTVVSSDADFDLIMVLPYPFNLDCLYPSEVEPGIFTLNLKGNINACSGDFLDNLFTKGSPRKLRTQLLRNIIFDNLEECISLFKDLWKNWSIDCKRYLTNFKVYFNNGSERTITIDLIPQIGVNLQRETIPGCDIKFDEVLSSYINDHLYHIFFVLAFPTNFQKSPTRHLLAHLNFGLLELSILESSRNARATVRMCKAISLNMKMRDLGLCHYHIKRKAVQFINNLEDADPYDGILIIFNELLEDLKRGYISGYFIPAQNVYTKNDVQRVQLCDIIEEVMEEIQEDDQSDYLEF